MAKNNKSGLGRGLDSLLGGYGAPVQSKSNAPEKKNESVKETTSEPVKPAPTRDVIRIEDLSEEDREAFGADAYEGSKNHQAPKPKLATQSRATKPASAPVQRVSAAATTPKSLISRYSKDILRPEDR